MDSAVAQVYQQDIGSRGKLGRMNFYKKGGKGTSPLGKKYMTDAEINARHGECKEYKLNRFMLFSEFRTMPPDIQALWINAIQDKYDVGLYPISRIIFNFPNDDSLKDHLQRNGIFKDVYPDRKRGKTGLQRLREDVENFRKGIGDDPQLVEVVPEKPVDPDIPKFMSWEQFKELEPDEKVIFINRIVNEYRIGMATIEHILWESKTQGNLRYVLIHEKIYDKFEISKSVTRNYKEGRERFERDVTAWKQAILANDIATVTPVCDNEDVDFAMAGIKGTLVHDPVTDAWYTTTINSEDIMKPLFAAEIVEEPEKTPTGIKFEFSREYFGREIDIDQLRLLNSMLESLEEGKQLRIRIEVEAVDNAG